MPRCQRKSATLFLQPAHPSGAADRTVGTLRTRFVKVIRCLKGNVGIEDLVDEAEHDRLDRMVNLCSSVLVAADVDFDVCCDLAKEVICRIFVKSLQVG